MIEGHARLDLAVFTKIAAVLNVTARYVGEEPASQVTGLYNQIMKEQLPKAGLVPATTLEYFHSPEAAPVLARIQKAGNVVHY